MSVTASALALVQQTDMDVCNFLLREWESLAPSEATLAEGKRARAAESRRGTQIGFSSLSVDRNGSGRD
jgi:hypothetical protein